MQVSSVSTLTVSSADIAVLPHTFYQLEQENPGGVHPFTQLFFSSTTSFHARRKSAKEEEAEKAAESFVRMVTPQPRPMPVCLLDVLGHRLRPCVGVDLVRNQSRNAFLCRREWRIVSDSQVLEKLQKKIVRFVSHQEGFSSEASLYTKHARQEAGQVFRNLCCSEPFCFYSVESASQHVLRGLFDVRWKQGSHRLTYLCLLDPCHGGGCLDFVRLKFHDVFVSALRVLPGPDPKLMGEPFSPRLMTAEGYLWNALKLTVVQLQQLWANEGPRVHVHEAVSLCCVCCIGSEIWCMNIGSNQALIVSENEHTIWTLGERMDFSDSSLTGSIEKRGGVIGRLDEPLNELAPALGNILLTPRVIGSIEVIGVAARPKISRLVFQKKAPVTVLITNQEFLARFSKMELLHALSSGAAPMQQADRIRSFIHSFFLQSRQRNEQCHMSIVGATLRF